MLPDPRDTDPLRVEPTQPVIRCSRCGDALPFGRIGRCDECIGRGGNPIGCLVLAIAFLLVAFIAASVLAAPRSAPEPTALLDVSQGASAPGSIGAPLPEAGDRLRPPASPSPPAVANVATSEGLQGPTTPMPAPRFRGLATWCAPTPDHCRGWDRQYVGAVPSFRFGDEPYAVQVCLADQPATCTHVVVTSYCACGDRRGQPTVVDLSVPAFRELAPLSRGVIAVIVSGPIAVPIGPTLPPTDEEDRP